MARIYDNIETKFADGLNDILTNAGVKRADFCVGYFNLRGWKLVTNQINQLQGEDIYEDDEKHHRICRLLIGMHRPPEDLVRAIYSQEDILPDSDLVKRSIIKVAESFRKQLTLGIPTKSDEDALRSLSSQMKDGKVSVKLYLKEPLHAKLYLAYRPEDRFNPIMAIMGSSNLTYSGLTGNGELDAEFGDSDNAKKLSDWFNDRWEDRYAIDITKELIQVIDNSWASTTVMPPYYIYLKTVYHLSQDVRDGMNEYDLPTDFKKQLFDFQVTAVKLAARHLSSSKIGGAMIGDVVGLGKTITACAVAKMFENRHACRTLIICPANLKNMWHNYIVRYDLNADVESMSKILEPKNMKYYRLLIIDESHNLRNSNGVHYHNIKDFIQYQDCKVLLLTATPYNKDFTDLSNQLKLFIPEDRDLGIRPERYIESLGGDRKFSLKHNEVYISSIRAFEKSTFEDDWRELMRLFLIRRTRTFIKNSYAKDDPSNQRKYLKFSNGERSYFPERRPKAIKFPTVEGDQYSRLYSQEMIDKMESLKLPRYGLSKYIDEKTISDLNDSEKQVTDNLSKAGQRMMGFCKSTFFKRIDSSGYSFLLTLYRHILRNMVFIYAVDNKLPLPIGDENELPENFLDDDDINMFEDSDKRLSVSEDSDNLAIPTDIEIYKKYAETYYQTISSGKSSGLAWIDSRYFKRSLKSDLKRDCNTLLEMISLCGTWNPSTDQKLNCLQQLISNDDKVVVFTQYSDTANYISRQLKHRGFKHVDCVTGGSSDPTSQVDLFSPLSNEKDIPLEQQTRVMIATDVLSEGQNLQDAHIVVNYDLPWAIIRLIQRAGRVDRIGQSSSEIFCYSFFPADGVENIIKLRKRLNDRINSNANIVGSDEVFFEGNEQNLRDMYNEKSGILDDDEEDSEVDLASQAFQVWKDATEANPKLKEIIPKLSNVIYSTKALPEGKACEGTITYAKTREGSDMLTWMDNDHNIVTQSQQTILKALSCSINDSALEPLENHHDLVGRSIKLMKSQEVKVSGMLGSTFSTKYRIYHLLENYISDSHNEIFVTNELKAAMDEIYNYPMKENARYILTRMFRRNADIEEFKNFVVELYKNSDLCIVDDDENKHKDPVIICSMGLRKI
jgi:superfamily II DNA or RNA helicase